MRRVECGRDEPDATVDLPLQTLDEGLFIRCDECGRDVFHLPLQALDKGLREGVRCESAEYASEGLRADAWCEREGR